MHKRTQKVEFETCKQKKCNARGNTLQGNYLFLITEMLLLYK